MRQNVGKLAEVAAPSGPFHVLWVTGTDTGVGKTHVARGLVRALHRARVPVAPLKLVETGVADAQVAGEDGVALHRCVDGALPLALVAPFRYALPASPVDAVRHQGTTLEPAVLLDAVKAAAALRELVVLEGAGGALVPLVAGKHGSFADFLAGLGAAALIVARDRLGTLNHTLLTVEALASRGIPVRAVVLDACGETPARLDHAGSLRALLPEEIRVVGPLPWTPGADDDTLADALVDAVSRAR